MTIGSSTRSRLKNILCMGCGKYFAKRQVEYIEGVPYCKDCKATGMEFKETVDSERDAILAGAEDTYYEKDKWEKAWSDTDMVSLSPERVGRLPFSIPLGGMEASLGLRVYSRLIDYALIGIVMLGLDMLFHLTLLARWAFGDLQIPERAYQYSSLLDPQGWAVLFENTNAARKVLLLAVGLLFIYRLFCYLAGSRTLGQLISGVFLATEQGKFPSRKARFSKAVVSSLGDAALIGPILEVLAYSVSQPRVSFSDAVGKIRAVRSDTWHETARKLVQRTSSVQVVNASSSSSGDNSY